MCEGRTHTPLRSPSPFLARFLAALGVESYALAWWLVVERDYPAAALIATVGLLTWQLAWSPLYQPKEER